MSCPIRKKEGVLVHKARKAPKKLTVRRPSAQYRGLAEMLRQQDQGNTPLKEAYASLALAIEIANENPFGFKFALGTLLRRIAARVGELQEVEFRLQGAQLRNEETAQWLIGFLVRHESHGRYNTTLVDACKIAGEALRVHAELPEIEWEHRYTYATPPNLARRVPVSV